MRLSLSRLLVTILLAALLLAPTARGAANTTNTTDSNETVQWVNETDQLIYLGGNVTVGNYSITAYEVRPDAYIDAVTENEGKNESCQPYPQNLNASLFPNSSRDWNYSKFNFNETDEYSNYIGSTFSNLSKLIEKRRVLGCDDWMLFRVTKNFNQSFSKIVGELRLGGGEGAIVFDDNRRVNEILPSEGEIENPDTKIIIKVKYLITGHLDSSYAVTGGNESYSTFYLPYAVIDVMTSEETSESKSPYLGLKFNKIFQLYRDTRHSGLIYVTLEMENRGNTDYPNIRVTDTLPPGFVLAGPYTPGMDWNFSLQAGRSWAARYSMRLVNPVQEKSYTIPQANAEVTLYGDTHYRFNSTSPWIPGLFQNVGAFTAITKTASKTRVEPGENVTITVRIENLGNRTGVVWVRDYLPPGTELLEGSLDFKRILQPRDISKIGFPLGGNTSEEVNITGWNTANWYYYENKYKIRLTSKSVTLPPAEAVYKEFYNNSFQQLNKLYQIVSAEAAVKTYKSAGGTLRSNSLSFGMVEILKPQLEIEAENGFDFGFLYPGSQTRWSKLKLKNTGTKTIQVNLLREGIFSHLQFYQGEEIEDSYSPTIPPGGSVETKMRLKIPAGYTPQQPSRIIYVVTEK